MSRMSEVHQDLESIHQILLGQRQQAVLNYQNSGESFYQGTIRCIDDLLLEFEAAGVVWPDNIAEIGPIIRDAGTGFKYFGPKE